MGVPKISIDYGSVKLAGVTREEWEARMRAIERLQEESRRLREQGQ